MDNFINHQMDPILMKSIGVEFVRRFASTSINKIITVEASGIAPAIMVGYLLELPVVFAKKKKPSTMETLLFPMALLQCYGTLLPVLAGSNISAVLMSAISLNIAISSGKL